MSAILTNAGALHFAQRIGSTIPTNPFDGIELGQGNTPVGAFDTRADMPNRIAGTLVQVASGYPQRNDQDAENPGRGDEVFSYRFDIPAGVAPFTATNLILTNFQAGAPSQVEPVGFAAQASLAKVSGEPLTFFLNFTSTDAQIIQATPTAHAASHALAGTDPIEAGGLKFTYPAQNYTPTALVEGGPVNTVAAHAKGIDAELSDMMTNSFYRVTYPDNGLPDNNLEASDVSTNIDEMTRLSIGNTAVKLTKVVITNASSSPSSVLSGEVRVGGADFGFSYDGQQADPRSIVVALGNGVEVNRGDSAAVAFTSINASSGLFDVAVHWFGEVITQ